MLDGLKKRLFSEQVRRDFAMIWRGLRGESPAPFTSTSGVATAHAEVADAAAPHTLEGRRVQIAEVRRETANAVTLVLEDPFGEPIPFQAGQFFTLTWPPRSRPGVTTFEKRAYSASCSALDPSRVAVTVKRVAGGVVSNAINDSAAVGEAIEVLGPSGNFTVPAGATDLVLIGGGSGITPLMSIARTELATRSDVSIQLLFGNRSEDEIIFARDIEALAAEHGPRFRVRHVLETPSARVPAAHGRLDDAVLRAELTSLAPPSAAIFFLCGPDPMMAAAERVLLERGTPREKIKLERFATLRRAESKGRTEHEATVIISGKRHTLHVLPSETLLEAGTRAGLDMPFSCTVGGCAACRVYLQEGKGKVTMDEPNCLSDQEAREGYILACVSRLSGPITVEVE